MERVTYQRVFNDNDWITLTIDGNVQIREGDNQELVYEFPETEVDYLIRVLLSVRRARNEDQFGHSLVDGIEQSTIDTLNAFLDEESQL